ncbi:zinc/cadmium resistance protein [Kryptolebias marmoratus]|uniref:Zinc/cadmium resistance protein-like n=1 Tax=Kryptolebias marmoratus TaxID=37003 RepID=A0A3Q3BH27_KRYMA|nr:zinc/cadmium resistance protein [Kryptolebias marmoratus]
MRVHWCMLGVTTLLLLGEIAISQLCKSLITMIDGFHTLFIIIHMTLPHPRTANIINPIMFSSMDPPASPSHASSFSGEPLRPLQPASPSPQPSREAPSLGNSPAAPRCGLSFPSSRVPAVGVFISALLLASLCISYFLEILSHMLEPHPVQVPLLPVVVGAVSLLCKTLLFVLNWDQLQDGRTDRCSQIKYKVRLGEESQGQEAAEHVVQSEVCSAAHDSLHSGALVYCNQGAASTPSADCKNKQQRQEIVSEAQSGAADLNPESRSERSPCQEHADGRDASKPSPSTCLLSVLLVLQGLFTSLLALTNSLVMLLIVPQLLHGSGAHSVLVYLDPAFSLLAVIALVASTVPQVYRYGLLLLQASPPQVCVSDLRRRIAGVPGVQDVHDLHIWQLTESLVVASVHVHCCPGFPAHRCADLVSGVANVLQNVGVSCCTVQPEFTSVSGAAPSSSSSSSSPPPPICSLSCGGACAASMCCSLLEEEAGTYLGPPAGEAKNDTVVIQNMSL